MTNPAAMLEAAGRALYGAEWQAPLAAVLPGRDGLGINPRTIRRWLSGASPVPLGVLNDLAAMLDRHSASAATLAAELRSAARAQP